MQSLLVISDEPGLAETLASELGEFAVTGVHTTDAEKVLHKGDYSLVIVDSAVDYPVDKESESTIKLVRPIRLSEAIYTILQKVKSKTTATKEEITLADGYVFLPAERLIRSCDTTREIVLTEKEVELLQRLIKSNGEVLSRDALLRDIWGYNSDVNTHTLETHIYRLRSKLKQASQSLDIIFLEEGGYQLNR